MTNTKLTNRFVDARHFRMPGGVGCGFWAGRKFSVRREKILLKVVQILLLSAFCSILCKAQNFSCLPPEVKLDAVASVRTVTSRSGAAHAENITVRQTLKSLKARCVMRKLVAGKGREIRFYFLKGCWGNPPADYLEIMDLQTEEIARLKKRYTVIEMTCGPTGGSQ
jgi:hypothetical protein